MGCTSSKNCDDPDCELPGHGRCDSRQNQRHRHRSQSYSYSAKSRRSSNTSTSSRTLMVQRDSVAEMRDIIASMGGWHEGDVTLGSSPVRSSKSCKRRSRR
uniref:Uncharacterized protein n=1 Tax=Kwoniella bestiolae CBS 10118 TaxID=1296100 RepID=A0A1B9GAB2_9TREE|nr:hypothetical protein I302_02800 [Kwoniella bestiolae CBS 10118]OCF27950.1 hypothetical protein I302_02800 [Kwoniella bestiolae CBS 10118]